MSFFWHSDSGMLEEEDGGMLEEEDSRLLSTLTALATNPISRTDPRKPAKVKEERFLAASTEKKKKKE